MIMKRRGRASKRGIADRPDSTRSGKVLEETGQAGAAGIGKSASEDRKRRSRLKYPGSCYID
ncbi:hypothetical protein BD779DRAFT_348585 [Infundibulicybe gibba]|nr:hypothetical protein BD779DRAFT_348585 [Infundibulicybe gibba]